jgi:error-prone DNA polymerase
LVYASAWIKRYEPAVFVAAMLNSQPMGFYAPAQLVASASDHGVEIRPVDVNHSEWDSTLEKIVQGPKSKAQGQEIKKDLYSSTLDFGPWTLDLALRLGFRMVKGLSQSQVDVILARRADGPFVSFDDFARRTRLTSAVLSRLSQADAFGSLTVGRRQALWKSLPSQKVMPLFENPKSKVQSPKSGEADEPVVALPSASPLSEVVADYRAIGLSLRDHPMKFLRPGLDKMRVAKASDLAVLPVDRLVKVAGLTLMRQRPGTASGITFVTLEDETGFANLIVRPEVWERYHHAARTATAMLAYGRLQRQDNVIHVLVNRLDDLSHRIEDLGVSSRDFH